MLGSLDSQWLHGYMLVVAYGLTLLWLGYSLGLVVADRRHRIAQCEHSRKTWRSLDGLDHHWSWYCDDCPEHRDVRTADVPTEIRRRAKNYRG